MVNAAIKERFYVTEVLKEGRAFKAYDIANGQNVFLKCWKSDKQGAVDEITMLTSIESPFAPKLICSFDDDGMSYCVEEWIKGKTLEAIIQERGILPTAVALRILYYICDALSFLHWSKHGAIIFADLNPSNIIVRGDIDTGQIDIALVDFETARRSNEDTQSVIRKNSRLQEQTFYMAPEASEGILIPISDIYSVGAILYEMVTGCSDTLDIMKADGLCAKIVRKCTYTDPLRRIPEVDSLKTVLSCVKLKIGRQECDELSLGDISGENDDLEASNTSSGIIKFDNSHEPPKTENDMEDEQGTDDNGQSIALRRYRRMSVMIDDNTCFANEMAQVASQGLGLRTAVFSLSDTGQRNIEYYCLDSLKPKQCVAESRVIYPMAFEHKSLYMRTVFDWLNRGLLHECNKNLYLGSYKLMLELPMRVDSDFEYFFDWCHANFDLVLFVVDRKDDPSDVDTIMKYCSAVITTPYASVFDFEMQRDYYVSLAEAQRVMMSKIKYVAWCYKETDNEHRGLFTQVVGRDKYLGEVTHINEKSRKTSRMPKYRMTPYYPDCEPQYEHIITNLMC